MMMAQNKTVTGKVLSAEDGEPIIGASVIVTGTTIGTVTDMDGKFSLNVPESAKTLRISFVGMEAKDVAIKDKMSVTLSSDDKILDDVVVTAMGMSRSEKTLGYAATTIKEEALTKAKSGSLMSGLQGKMAGVQISGGGSTGQSQKVIIRGISSLNSNTPLYIVDGVPINSERAGNNYADFGSGEGDINPEDIASVTVLKGASATALYGSRAANGVVMITTKKPEQNAKPQVTYDGSIQFTNILRAPMTQNMFGEGWGSWSNEENGSWGPLLDGRDHWWGSTELAETMVKPYSFVKDNIRNFYKTGTELNNNLSVSYGTDKVGAIFSYGNVKSNGILPNNADNYQRNTFSLRGYANYNRFHINMAMNYVRKDERRVDAYDTYMELLQGVADVDFSQMKDYNDERYNLDNYFTFYAVNPYFRVDNNYYKYHSDRFYGNLELKFDITKDIHLIGRLGGDVNTYNTKYRTAEIKFSEGSYQANGNGSTISDALGTYSNYSYNRSQIDASVLLTGDHKWGQFSFNGTLGWNLNERSYEYVGAANSDLDINGWYSLDNTTSYSKAEDYVSKRRNIGLLGQLEFGWSDWAFLTLNARNDWSSTLPINANSFFYGGVSASVLLNRAIKPLQEASWLDLLKVRASIGQTGNDAGVYMTSAYFIPYSGYYYTYLPINGASGLTEYNRKPSSDLKPEITTEVEFGLTANFFHNRFGIDFAYYDRDTKDQIISATLAPETGYTSETRNVGKLNNHGIELAVNATPIRTRDWEWTLGLTFSKNWSKVKELWDGLDEYAYTNWRGIYLVMKEGEEIGQFRVPATATVEDPSSPYYGAVIVNNNGAPTTNSTKYEYMGGSQPDFVMGLTTQVRWKNLSASATLDWHQGGHMVSNTSYITHFNGNSTETVKNNRNGFVWPNSVRVVNGEYVENNIPIRSDQFCYFIGNYSYSPEVTKEFIVDRTYLKVREIAVNYDFPKTLIAKTKVLTGATIGVVAHNPFLFTPKSQNYIDPESSNLGNDLSSEFGETTGTISTRSWGINLKLHF